MTEGPLFRTLRKGGALGPAQPLKEDLVIQLLLGHASIQTTERYLGTQQDLAQAVNDPVKIRIE